MHELLSGGSISRIYLDPDEEMSCMGFISETENDPEIFREFIAGVLKSSDIPLFQLIPLRKSLEATYPVTGVLDPEVRILRNAA